jgi:TolA-binding protein
MVQSSEVLMEEGPEEEGTKEPELEKPEQVTLPGAEAGPAAAPPRPKSTRRAALRIVREVVEKASKDITTLAKSHEVTNARLQKQLSTLRNDLASLKSAITRENERIQQKQSALLSKILAKLSTQKAAPKPKASTTPRAAAKKKTTTTTTSSAKSKTKSKKTK